MSQYHRQSQSQSSQVVSSQVSPDRSSPLRRTGGGQSEGVYSSSTHNLEKAYEDLEREILEIKQKLQGSSIGPSPGPDARRSQHQYSQEPDII